MARVLLECGNALVALDRVEALEDAGHQVAACDGPDFNACPVLHGEVCDAVAQSDVVISCLGEQTLRVTLANRLVHPDRPVVAVITGPEFSDIAHAVDGVHLIGSGASDQALVETVTAAAQQHMDEETSS